MSEVHSNEHQEQNTTENQQQNVEVVVQNQTQAQEQSAEQRQQEKRQLTIQTNLPQPTSPKQGENTQNISSPRDGSQKIIKPQSPELIKGKLDTLRNLYNKKVEQFEAIDKSGFEKEQQLQDLKVLLADAQKVEAEKVNFSAQKVSEKNQIISVLESRLAQLKSNDIASSHSQKVNQIHQEIVNASQKIHERENQGRKQIIQSKVTEKIGSLTQGLQGLSSKRDQILSSVNEKNSKLSDQRNHLESLLNKLIESTKNNNSVRLAELESQHKNVQQEIQNRKQQINKLKGDIDFVKNSEIPSSQVPDLSGLKSAVEEAKKTKAQLQREIETQQKEFKEIANKIKSNESTIENKKAKNSQLNEKTKKLEEQKNKLQQEVGGEKKKPKFEQKIPEQILTLRARKAALQKEVKQEVQRTDKQRNKQDDLVPPSVIETMKQKIANTKEKNERYSKLIVESNRLREENAKLDATKEAMQWETSTQYKIVDANVQKQQAKHNALEVQIVEVRNKNIQVANKLQEYTNQYPDFKPEKKMKKSEPAPIQPGKGQQTQAKKEVQQPIVEQKGGKKKKGGKASPQTSQTFVPEVVEEKPSPLIQEVQKKQEPKSGKNKNKSKKSKQSEEPVAQKKEEPVKKEEPAPKVEPSKKEQPVKKEEPKVENKSAQQGGQGNKKNKKR